jgi:hypothetical protein
MVNIYKMDRYIQANGTIKKTPRKAMVFKYGQMVPNTKDFGKLIWLKVSEDSF